VSDLLAGLLGVLVATNPPGALSNLVRERTGVSIQVPNPNDPVERAYQKLMEDDDAAQAEVDGWIQASTKAGEHWTAVDEAALRARIRQRFEPVKKAYEDFLKTHPQHARARLAYGSFLGDIGEEDAARQQWEKAREADPKNPAAWNNLANWHGHNGPVSKAFEYYVKAIDLNPVEPVYYQNLATTVFLFRKDAQEFFKLTEPEVFARAMQLYRKALELDPQNFVLATDYAQSYYGYSPAKTGDADADRQAAQKHAEDALAAWQTALKLARDDVERQGVLLHFARIQLNAGRLKDARHSLAGVTNEMFNVVKGRLTKRLAEKSPGATPTNAPSVK
jgi:tetratricopeptide (TPR) repeat protein